MDVNSLTIDFRKMERATAKDKLNSTQRGPHTPSFLASLTPTQLAEMFPDYYKRELPDIGKSTSGATPLSGQIPGTATQIPGGYPSTRIPSTATQAPPGAEITEKPRQNLTYEERVERAYQQKTQRLMPKGGSPLAKQRQAVAKNNMNMTVNVNGMTVNTKDHLLALAAAEVGRRNTDSLKSVMETMFNRNAAEGKATLGESLQSNYYQPLRPGADPNGWRRYTRALNDLQKNPAFRDKMESIYSDVLKGSNLTDYATHNASGSVAQTAVTQYDADPRTLRKIGDETYYRKTFPFEQNWYDQILQQQAQFAETSAKALSDASAIPEQDASKTGSTALDAMRKPEDKKAKAQTLPDGLDENVKKYVGTLTPEKQLTFIGRINEIGVEQANKLYQEYQTDQTQLQAIREKTKEIITGDSRDQFGFTGSAAQRGMSQVDPRLVKITEEAAKTFPLRVRLFSGKRNSGAHGAGLAVDTELFDESGNPIASYQTEQSANIYRLWADHMRKTQMQLYPELKNEFAWGGGFGGKHRYGSRDYMDFRIGNWNGFNAKTMRGYDWENGWKRGYAPSANVDILGIGDRPVTPEDLQKLQGLRLSKEQLNTQYWIAKKGGFNAGLLGHQNIGERTYPTEAVQTASEVTPPSQEEVAKSQAIQPERPEMNMRGIDISGMPFPKSADMPVDFIHDWNNLSLQQRQEAMGAIRKGYEEHPLKAFAGPNDIRKRIIEGWNKKKSEAIKAGTYRAPPLTAVPAQPQAPPSTTLKTSDGKTTYQNPGFTGATPQQATPQAAPKQATPPPPVQAPPPPPTPPPPEPTPDMFAGGEKQVGEDRAIINKRTGKVEANLNSTERVQVIPQHRASDEEIQKKAQETQATTTEQASQKKEMTTTQQQATPKPRPQQRDPNLTLYENARLSAQSRDPYKTDSNKRAMARRHFMETSNDSVAGHYSDGAANMKL